MADKFTFYGLDLYNIPRAFPVTMSEDGHMHTASYGCYTSRAEHPWDAREQLRCAIAKGTETRICGHKCVNSDAIDPVIVTFKVIRMTPEEITNLLAFIVAY